MLALVSSKDNNGGTFMANLSIQDIAHWFLAKESMTHKKLQKLCYYAVAWGYALTDAKIASNSEFEAWVHGPASPVIYRIYKNMGWNLIPKFTGEVVAPDNVAELLEAVWLTYGDKGGNELEALSHSEKPWIDARKGLASSESSDNSIEPSVMKEFYNSIKSSAY